MIIEIDGSPVNKPAYAKSLPTSQYIEYMVNAPSHKEHGWTGIWQGGATNGVNVEVLDRLAQDEIFHNLVAGIIKNGADYKAMQLASNLADHLADSGEILELSCKGNRKAFSAGLVKEYAKRYCGDLDVAAYQLGVGLKKGTLVMRGNVGEVSALRGGTLYVDGDVNKLTQCPEGIVYVNGDVNLLEDSQKGIFVVAGQIKKYVQYRRSHGGARREVTPSPFIFTSHEVTKEVPDKWGKNDSNNVLAEVPPSFVVPEGKIRDWKPEETTEKALGLCKDRITSYLDDLKKIAERAGDAKTMARFARYNMFGYTEGSSSGYYQGSNDATPSWMVD